MLPWTHINSPKEFSQICSIIVSRILKVYQFRTHIRHRLRNSCLSCSPTSCYTKIRDQWLVDHPCNRTLCIDSSYQSTPRPSIQSMSNGLGYRAWIKNQMTERALMLHQFFGFISHFHRPHIPCQLVNVLRANGERRRRNGSQRRNSLSHYQVVFTILIMIYLSRTFRPRNKRSEKNLCWEVSCLR